MGALGKERENQQAVLVLSSLARMIFFVLLDSYLDIRVVLVIGVRFLHRGTTGHHACEHQPEHLHTHKTPKHKFRTVSLSLSLFFLPLHRSLSFISLIFFFLSLLFFLTSLLEFLSWFFALTTYFLPVVFRRRVLLLVAVVILMITIALLLICSKQIYPNRPSLLLDFE